MNYFKADEKASLDTIFIPYIFDVAKKILPKHSKTLTDYSITNFILQDKFYFSFLFTPQIKTDHSVTLFLTELRVRNQIIPIRCKKYDMSKNSELKIKTHFSRKN